MNWKKTYGALCMGVALAACDGADAPTETAAPVTRTGIESVSQSFALAMQDATVRAAVRDAMRASLVSEHKLVLQDYVDTQSGQVLVAAAARAAGVTPQALRAEIARLPELDFYVASRQQRLTWAGSDRVAVAGTLQEDPKALNGFDAAGRRVELRSSATPAGIEAVFVLQPAEVKHLRVHPQAPGQGSVIQEAYDGEWAGAVTETDARGVVTTTQYVDLVPGGRVPVGSEAARAAIAGTDGPAYVTTTGPGVFFTYLNMGDDDGVGACEMIFRTTVQDANGSTVGSMAEHTASSVECPRAHTWETRFPPRGRRGSSVVPPSGGKVLVSVYEDDQFQDDFVGANTWNASLFSSEFGLNKELQRSICDGLGCYWDLGGTLTVKWYAS